MQISHHACAGMSRPKPYTGKHPHSGIPYIHDLCLAAGPACLAHEQANPTLSFKEGNDD